MQRELPQLEAQYIHNAQLAQYVKEWQRYRAASLVIQVSIECKTTLIIDPTSLPLVRSRLCECSMTCIIYWHISMHSCVACGHAIACIWPMRQGLCSCTSPCIDNTCCMICTHHTCLEDDPKCTQTFPRADTIVHPRQRTRPSSAHNGVWHVQIEGPNVAPLTVGKQNLLVHVLRQLEKHFYEVNQFFRVYSCSHDEGLQQASISLAVVSHTEITVGLDVVRSILTLPAFWLLVQVVLQGAGALQFVLFCNACMLSSALKACYNIILAALLLPFGSHATPPTHLTPPHPCPTLPPCGCNCLHKL